MRNRVSSFFPSFFNDERLALRILNLENLEKKKCLALWILRFLGLRLWYC